jgi:hypothetical protein
MEIGVPGGTLSISERTRHESAAPRLSGNRF